LGNVKSNFFFLQLVVAGFSLRLEALACVLCISLLLRNLKVAATIKLLTLPDLKIFQGSFDITD